MNTKTRNRILGIALAALGLISVGAYAQDAPAPRDTQLERADPPKPEAEAGNAATIPVPSADEEPQMTWDRGGPRRSGRNINRSGDEIFSFGGNSRLPAGERADSVVSVFGSSTSAGEVRDAIVSVFGSTRVEGGTVGDAAVAVFGDNYINAPVNGDVVAVMGSVELGPKADVRGNVVVVGGQLQRDALARLHGGVQHVMSMPVGILTGLRAWMAECARYVRPLAFAPGLAWAWTIALAFLALYVFIGLMFREPVDRCVKTLQEHPGQTLITALLAMLLTPVLLVILCITVIGIVFVPIVSFAIFLATLFGKAVVLAWIGRGLLRLVDDEDKLNPALAVLAGGVVMLLLYTVPVIGFIAYNVLGFLAFGAVLYTLLLAARARRRSAPKPTFTPGGSVGGPGVAPSASGAGYAASGGSTFFAAADGTTTGGYSAAPDPAASGAAAGTTGAQAYASAAGGGETGGPSGAQGYGYADTSGGSGGYTPPPPPPGVQPAVNEALSLPRAGFWIRMLALLIDLILVGLVFSALDHNHQLQLLALAAYGAIMWKLKGTTVGGIVCNLKVVRTDGRPIDWSTAIVRALGCFLSLVVCGLGFIWIAFDEGKQSWHDKLAGTAVVRAPQGVSLL